MSEPQTTLTPEAMRAGVLAHLESCRQRGAPYGRYRYAPGCPVTRLASAFAALTRALLGDLPASGTAERDEWLDYLLDGQDERTGLFIDPQYDPADRAGNHPHHTAQLHHWHASTFIAGAIDRLGGRIAHPVAATHFLREPGAMTRWIEQLPWAHSPWIVGNWTYDTGSLLGWDHAVTGESANLEAMDEFFAFHDARQDAGTGWWDLAGGHAVRPQQHGGYHTLMVYWMYDRPVPRPEAMIDSSLTLRLDNGSFGGGCCPDMDVIDAAVSLARQYDIRRERVAEAMGPALRWQLAQWAPGGGFIDTPGGRAEFGWNGCRAAPGQADPCTDFFRAFNVALCSEVVGGTGFEKIDWRHHSTYVHGVRPKSLIAATP